MVLSIDGRKEVHDKMRPFRKGAGSYDLIVPKFQKFAESRNQDKYYVRGTFTHNNLDFPRMFCILQIWIQADFCRACSGSRMRSPTHFGGRSSEDLEEYDRLAKEMIKREKEGKGFNFFHFMIDLTGGPCVYKTAFRMWIRNRVSGSYPMG